MTTQTETAATAERVSIWPVCRFTGCNADSTIRLAQISRDFDHTGPGWNAHLKIYGSDYCHRHAESVMGTYSLLSSSGFVYGVITGPVTPLAAPRPLADGTAA